MMTFERLPRIPSCLVAFSIVAHAASGGVCNAQAPVLLQAGVRVSVMVPDSSCHFARFRPCERAAALEGVLVRATPDTLHVEFRPGIVFPIPRSANQRIFVRQPPSRTRSAMTTALSFGMAAGFLVASTDATTKSKAQTIGSIAAVSLVLGAVFPMPRWRRVAP